MKAGVEALTIIIGDNSGFSRLVLSDILNGVPGLEVVETATTGNELLEKVKKHRPSLVIADENLSQNGRLFTFFRIAADVPTPILMLSKKEVFEPNLLERLTAAGVYDIIRKPNNALHPNFREIALEIVSKVKNVSQYKKEPLTLLKNRRTLFPKAESNPVLKVRKTTRKPFGIVVIGGSTGGTVAVENIIRSLNPNLNAVILVAVHLPAHFTRSFIARLQEITAFPVRQGSEKMELESQTIIVAPGGRNMIVKADNLKPEKLTISFSEEEVPEFDQPSVDLLMKSVAMVAGKQTLGVILTGMGYDGTLGARYLLKNGGTTIAQNEASSVIFGMAKSAIDQGLVKEVLDLKLIPDFIHAFVKQQQVFNYH